MEYLQETHKNVQPPGMFFLNEDNRSRPILVENGIGIIPEIRVTKA